MTRSPKKGSIRDLSRAPQKELRPLLELITDPQHPDAAVVLLGAAILERSPRAS
jgi:hypothetical protein